MSEGNVCYCLLAETLECIVTVCSLEDTYKLNIVQPKALSLVDFCIVSR